VKSTSYEAPHYAVFSTSFLLDQNILLSTLFSDILNVCSSFSVRHQISHPCKISDTITVLYVVICATFENYRTLHHHHSTSTKRRD